MLSDIKAPKNEYAYISNENDDAVYFDNFTVSDTRGRIIEENHYYAFGLKIAGISSVKMGDVNEGSLKNKYQYQGDYSEMDEDIGWNDFELRDCDAQVGRFVQADPLGQFPSSYMGMGNDPVNLIDSSGGWASTGIFTGLNGLEKTAVTTLGGAIVGTAVDIISGGDGLKGLLIGTGLGLGSNFNIGDFASASLKVGGEVLSNTDKNLTIGQSTSNSYAQWAGYNEYRFPPFKTLLSNYPLPYKIRPDRTPINSQFPLNDLTGDNFLYFNQCAIRVSLALRRSGVSLGGALNISNPPPNGPRLAPTHNGNILAAKNLAGFLFKFSLPEVYNGTKMDVVSKLKNRTGIVYFENFIEDGRRSSSATHIDRWDKTHYMSPFPFSQMFDATKIPFFGARL